MNSQIPAHLLPKSLKNAIQLKRIKRVDLLAQKGSAMFVPSLVFLKKYAPSIKYHNEGFKLNRQFHEEKTVKLLCFNEKNEKVGEFEPVHMEAETILQKLMDIDNGVTTTSTAEAAKQAVTDVPKGDSQLS